MIGRLAPLEEGSPLAAFLARSGGGLHHVCYDVADIVVARDWPMAGGARVLGDGGLRVGAHGKPVLFLYPEEFSGALIELQPA